MLLPTLTYDDDCATSHPWDREASEAIVRGIEEDIIIQQQCQCIVNYKFRMSSSVSLCDIDAINYANAEV